MGKDDLDRRHIRRQIVRLRAARQMTQEAFAEHVKLSSRTISLIETGRKNAGLESLLKIARAFGMTLDAFVSGNHLSESVKDGTNFLRLIADCDDRERHILHETLCALKASLRDRPC